MSRQLVSRSPDLRRLQEEGYDLTITRQYLLVRVPYVNAQRQVAYGRLVSTLTIEGGDHTGTPDTHVMNFVGATADDLPCDAAGNSLMELINQVAQIPLEDGLVASCTFSHKPVTGYPDYYEKMTTYAEMLLAEVHEIDPSVKLQTFPPIAADEAESAFRYFDSATSRARIGAVTDRIRGQKLAIVGLGGTGSYILDAVAKTPAREIHLYDGDLLLAHNAFRSPGASTLEELQAQPYKVDYHQHTYDAMHRHVIAHQSHVTEDNIRELADADFVFISMDTGPAKLLIVQRLQQFGVPFVDTGMGIYQAGDALGGIVRTTASNSKQSDPEWINNNISFASEDDDEYEQNIQIAELNMLNAALAVIKWKKYFGFYADFENEISSDYTIDGNHMDNEGGVDEN